MIQHKMSCVWWVQLKIFSLYLFEDWQLSWQGSQVYAIFCKLIDSFSCETLFGFSSSGKILNLCQTALSRANRMRSPTMSSYEVSLKKVFHTLLSLFCIIMMVCHKVQRNVILMNRGEALQQWGMINELKSFMKSFYMSGWWPLNLKNFM